MLLMTTVDDLPAEGLPYIIERTMDEGANNIHVLNAFTKKGRIEYIVLVDVDNDKLEDISSLLALEFGTLGMKLFQTEHLALPFKIKTTLVKIKNKGSEIDSEVRIKYLKREDGGAISLKAEYDDILKTVEQLAQFGLKISFSKLKSVIEAEAYKSILKDEDVVIEVDQ